MNDLKDYLDKLLLCLTRLNSQIGELEYRLVMIEEQIKDTNENLESIKHNIMRSPANKSYI